MKSVRAVVAVLLLGLVVSAAADSHSVWDWRQDPDFTSLRNELGWQDDFFERCELPRPLGEMSDLMYEEKWKEASEIGLPWLQICPIDIRAHYYTGVSLKKLGNNQDAEHHFRWVNGLMDSVLATGDGRTQETAYVTISTSEEYDVLYFFGLKPIKQALVTGERFLDAFTALSEDDGKEYKIYFYPEAHFARLTAMYPDEDEAVRKRTKRDKR